MPRLEPGHTDLFDRPLHLSASGLPPHSRATIRARTADPGGRPWWSWASFDADDAGHVAVWRDAPVDGTYTGVDPLGLLWSLAPAGAAASMAGWSNFVVTFHLVVNGAVVAEAVALRSPLLEGVVHEKVAPPAAGELFLPDRPGPHPGVVVLGGTEGTPPWPTASLLASHGYAALALQYLRAHQGGRRGGRMGERRHQGRSEGRYEGRYEAARAGPRGARGVPLEYFQDAIGWLLARNDVRGAGVGLVGHSLGGTVALWLASLDPRVAATVAVSAPTLFMPRRAVSRAAPFTAAGRPLPFLVPSLRGAARFFRERSEGQAALAGALAGGRDLNPLAAPLERAEGPISLLYGHADPIAPPAFFRAGADRAARAGRDVECVALAGAGHVFGLPGVPSGDRTLRRLGPLFEQTSGGCAAANAAAGRQAWSTILRRLSESVGPATEVCHYGAVWSLAGGESSDGFTEIAATCTVLAEPASAVRVMCAVGARVGEGSAHWVRLALAVQPDGQRCVSVDRPDGTTLIPVVWSAGVGYRLALSARGEECELSVDGRVVGLIPAPARLRAPVIRLHAISWSHEPLDTLWQQVVGTGRGGSRVELSLDPDDPPRPAQHRAELRAEGSVRLVVAVPPTARPFTRRAGGGGV